VPRCGTLSLLKKTLYYRGDPAKAAAGLNEKLWNSVVVVVVACYPLLIGPSVLFVLKAPFFVSFLRELSAIFDNFS
jgi:hypothetical protein